MADVMNRYGLDTGRSAREVVRESISRNPPTSLQSRHSRGAGRPLGGEASHSWPGGPQTPDSPHTLDEAHYLERDRFRSAGDRPVLPVPTRPRNPLGDPTFSDSRDSSRCSRPKGDVEDSAISRACEHLRAYARKLDPFSLAFTYFSGVNFPRATLLRSAARWLKWGRSLEAYSSI